MGKKKKKEKKENSAEPECKEEKNNKNSTDSECKKEKKNKQKNNKSSIESESKKKKKYTYYHKQKIKNKIMRKIRDKNDWIKIYNIIHKYDPSSISTNHNGMHIIFSKLTDNTYRKIEIMLRKISKKGTFTDDSDSVSRERKEYKPYAKDPYLLESNISPKLKLSNKDRSLLNRLKYNKYINSDADRNIVYLTCSDDTENTRNI